MNIQLCAGSAPSAAVTDGRVAALCVPGADDLLAPVTGGSLRVYFRQVAADLDPLLLTIPEACAALRVSKWTLYRLIHSRQLETVKIGSRRLVPSGAVQHLVDRLREETS